jgi:hypothetical protein
MNGELAPRNDNNFWLLGLTDEKLGTFVNNASVSWEIRTAKYPDGAAILSGSGSHVTSSDGDYVCDVPASDLLIPGTKYVRRLIATSAAGGYDAQDYFVAAGRTGRTPTT